MSPSLRGDYTMRVVALDAPGCGTKRDRQTVGMSLEDVAHELVRDVEDRGLSDVVLVGHSQAGQAMALMMAIKPALFRRFVYVSCSIPLPGQSVRQPFGAGRQGENPAEVGWPFDPGVTRIEEHYGTMFCNDMDQATRDGFLANLGRDQWPVDTYSFTSWLHEGLGAIPSTFMICLRDNVLPLAWQERFADRFKSDRVIRIDAGHQVMLTRPQALAEALLADAG